MNKKETIETQLDCKATATLRESIQEDLKKEDGSLSTLLDIKEKEDEPKIPSN